MSMARMPTFSGRATIASKGGGREGDGVRRAGVVGRPVGEIYVYIGGKKKACGGNADISCCISKVSD